MSSRFTYLLKNLSDKNVQDVFDISSMCFNEGTCSDFYTQIIRSERFYVELETLSNDSLNYSGRPLMNKSGVKRIALEIKSEGPFLRIDLEIA